LLSVPRDILIPRQIPIRLVSPFDFQTAAHQLEQARAAGFDIGENNVIKDEGVSGISTCFAERDGGRRLLDKLRPGDVLVVRWLDRLGHNYDNVRDTVQALRVRFGT
jgi:DNA invertase Pin-like site-specific DNA recombinase